MTAANGTREQAVADDPVLGSERAVLGAVAGSLDAARQAIGCHLEARHFRHPYHAEIYAAVLRLASGPIPAVEPAAVAAELARTGALAHADHTPAELVRGLAAYAGVVAHHAPLVVAAWHHRNIRGALAEAADTAEAPGWDPAASPGKIRDLIAAATSLSIPSPLLPHSVVLGDLLDAVDREPDPSIPTGFPELDQVIGGLVPRTQIVIAARSGVGKTLTGLAIADHVSCELGMTVLVSSLEMPGDELTARRVASVAGVPLRKLLRHQMTPTDWDRVAAVSGYLAGAQLFIDDAPRQTMAHIRARLAELDRAGTPAGLHILDHLGLVSGPRADSRQQEVAALTEEHRLIGRELNIPVITLHQLNRGPELRKDPTPKLSDLRESGAVEQTADIVLLLHREDRDSPDLRVIVAKNRRGPMDTVLLGFQGHLARVSSKTAGRSWTPTTIIGGLRDKRRRSR